MTYLINNNNKIINLSLLNIGLYLDLFGSHWVTYNIFIMRL